MKTDTTGRLLQFLGGVLACALTTGIAAFVAGFAVLPPNDLARKQGLLLTLLDPLVLIVFLFITLVTALIAYPIALWALWRVRLNKAVPLVVAVSVTAATLAALSYEPLSAPVALLAACVAMVWCRFYRPWRLENTGHTDIPAA
jgi:hypothetical protein